MKAILEIDSLSAIEHIIKHRPARIARIIFFSAGNQLNARLTHVRENARRSGVKIDFSPGKSQVPLRAEIHPFSYLSLDHWLGKVQDTLRPIVLALDHLQDPHNFGALCRTADAFNVAGILLPKDRSVEVSPGVYHASVGTVETVPIIRVTNLSSSLRELKEEGFWIVGTSLDKQAEPPWKLPDYQKVVLVLGAELEGLRRGTENVCDWRIEIPLEANVGSLNVSVAGSLLIYELWRRNKVTTADRESGGGTP